MNRHQLALKGRWGRYKEMLEKCPMNTCEGKPVEMRRTSNRRKYHQCDKCETKFTVSYTPYLRIINNG